MSWRYVATRLNGDGTESILDTDLPLSDVSLTWALSGTDGLQAKITPEVMRLKGEDGLPILDHRWSTAVYAEVDGLLRHGTVVTGIEPKNFELGITGTGFTGYAKDQVFETERSRIQTDPLVEARNIWNYLQGHRDGNLGLVVDDTTSPVRIGTKKKDVKFTTGDGEDVDFEAGPYVLAWYKTDDLGAEFDKLSESTPFDYRVEHAWNGDTITHRLRLGYPTLGRRRNDLRFVIGENFAEVPDVDFSGEDYANELWLLGAGEGRKMKRGRAGHAPVGLRRAAVIVDKSIAWGSAAKKFAESELARRSGDIDVSEIVVRNHPHAPIGSYDVGDEIYLQGDAGWGGDLNLWVRIVASTISPNDSDVAKLSVVRTDKIGA